MFEDDLSGGAALRLRLSLLENAYDSLNESLAKVDQTAEDPGKWKFALLHLVHATELLLKQRLHDEHRLLLFESVDHPSKTVSLELALDRLKRIDVQLADSDISAIKLAIKWRNNITHFETDLVLGDVRRNFLIIFEFLDSFHESHFASGIADRVLDKHTHVAISLIEDFKRETIDFKGRPMHKTWPSQLLQAQEFSGISVEGVTFRRIPRGSESHWVQSIAEGYIPQEFCHDCACGIGELHGPGCDSEECPSCGGQFLGCDCEFDPSEFWDIEQT